MLSPVSHLFLGIFWWILLDFPTVSVLFTRVHHAPHKRVPAGRQRNLDNLIDLKSQEAAQEGAHPVHQEVLPSICSLASKRQTRRHDRVHVHPRKTNTCKQIKFAINNDRWSQVFVIFFSDCIRSKIKHECCITRVWGLCMGRAPSSPL